MMEAPPPKEESSGEREFKNFPLGEKTRACLVEIKAVDIPKLKKTNGVYEELEETRRGYRFIFKATELEEMFCTPFPVAFSYSESGGFFKMMQKLYDTSLSHFEFEGSPSFLVEEQEEEFVKAAEYLEGKLFDIEMKEITTKKGITMPVYKRAIPVKEGGKLVQWDKWVPADEYKAKQAEEQKAMDEALDFGDDEIPI